LLRLPAPFRELNLGLPKNLTHRFDVRDFHLLVRLRVFNTEQMNQAVHAFRRYEDASLAYTGIDSHPNLTRYGLYDTVIARDASEVG
jgi:hypothetical protein